jgi:hypothetical protein
MRATIEAPRELVESFANMQFPRKANQQLQKLMDRNNEGLLTPGERRQLEALAELSETIAIARAKALALLKRTAR